MRLICMVIMLLASNAVVGAVGANIVVGEVYDITSTVSGLLIRVKDTQATNIVPTDCQNPGPYGWMLIPEASKTMISVAIAMRAQGKRDAAIYVNPTTSGPCDIIQYDPKD